MGWGENFLALPCIERENNFFLTDLFFFIKFFFFFVFVSVCRNSQVVT